MAQHLANIFGTEKDRVNCPFYFKIGYVIWPNPASLVNGEIALFAAVFVRIKNISILAYHGSIRSCLFGIVGVWLLKKFSCTSRGYSLQACP